LVKVPLLGFDILSPSLEPYIVGSMAFSNSVEWKFGDHVEWSIDVEVEILVDTLGWISLHFINIDNIPFLASTTAVAKNLDCLSFNILGSSDIKYFTVLPINELATLVLENLEPSRVSAPDLHVVGLTSTLDVP
jgi:hypothetical protein